MGTIKPWPMPPPTSFGRRQRQEHLKPQGANTCFPNHAGLPCNQHNLTKSKKKHDKSHLPGFQFISNKASKEFLCSSRHFEGNPRHSELTLFLLVTFWEYFWSDFHLHITFSQLFGNIMGGNIGELVNTNFIFSYVKICKKKQGS